MTTIEGHADDPDKPVVQGPAVRRIVADAVVPCEGTGRVIEAGAVDVDAAGRVVGVGTERALGPPPAHVERIGGLVLPGLVNSHAHTPMTLLRSVGDGLPLQRWLEDEIWPREGRLTAEDAWWGMTLGSAEMLACGVTTSAEMYIHEEAIVEAVVASGARTLLTPGVISALLPAGQVDARIDELRTVHRTRHDPAGRIHIGFAPHSVYDLTPEQCGEIARAAVEVDATVHIHLEETEAERALVIERYGASATRVLADAGLFDAHVLAADGVWLDGDDRRILAGAGAAVAHCPQSNLKLGSGIAEVGELLAAGVTVSIGTDGPASNDDLDLWQELTLAPLLARGRAHDPTAMDAVVALDLATRQGGLATGITDIGELRVGAWADLIRIDLDQPAFAPAGNLVQHLVFAGSSRFVTDVWVAGTRVVRDGTVLTVDVERATAEVRARAARLAGSGRTA